MIPEASPTRFEVKCQFVGLDNGGKTSLLLMLENKLIHVLKTKPTKRISISDFYVLGVPIKIWDMGGQRKYINEYLAKPYYFGETKLLFFVIDIQDPARFDSALKYYEAIINNFIVMGAIPKIVVLLHKSDPDLKDSVMLNRNLYVIKRQLSELPNSEKITIHETSIYEPDTFHHIFVQAVFSVLPGGYKVQELLTQFMTDIKADAIRLIGENLLTVAEVHVDKKSREICYICGKNLTSMAKELSEISWAIPSRIGIELDGWVFYKHVPYLETRFYLIFFTKLQESLQSLTEFLPKFISDLTNAMDYVV
ncbi:MAG: ADP-ribosylation factor-like protein [Candidatus Helarchaeota archaeon]